MIRTKAKQFTRHQLYGEQIDAYDAEVPPRFYWAEMGEALLANWRSGDFETYVKDPLVQVRWSVIGLQFDLRGVQELESECALPPLAAESTAPAPVPSQNKSGRPTTYNWEEALIGLIAKAEIDGLNIEPERGAIAKIAELLRQEFVSMGSNEPSKSELDKRASRILKALYPQS